ncbi:TetR/AcrR family transcriptional regulator [Nocardia suismassiliense]|uniref:TetR/AcrR family transcriptional regulator n=1 Tax=Nocardia suismassiliense TaxID=2077092 RepID=UPI00131EDFA1|nr:TetR/AcrR family transcriptional regulator [Nocardia suismassiliense]
MPKALTREELQARTREQILTAAQVVFLTRGYNATTMGQIAAEAGRSHGSIYSNFAGKEELCLEVLRIHFEQVLADLSHAVLAMRGVDAKLAATREQWRRLLEQSEWISLAADFVMATRNNPEQEQANRATIDMFTAGLQALLYAQAATEDIVVDDPALVEQAIAALVATGVGLAVGQALGAVPREVATNAFIENLNVWIQRTEIRRS